MEGLWGFGQKCYTHGALRRYNGPLPTYCELEKMYDGIHLDEGLATEILLLLPAKSVLRFRAVCREWLRIIDGPGFLAAHARRRPLEVVVHTKTTVASVDLQELDAVDVSAHRRAPRRHLARYPEKTGALNYNRYKYDRRQYWRYCSLLASCDGLLLLRDNAPLPGDDHGAERYLVCNPATRQWSDLPRLSWAAGGRHNSVAQRESGFYFHEPSGEYRLLCHITSSRMEVPYYYVFSTGADEPRPLSAQATPMHASNSKAKLFIWKVMTPAVLHGHLHWLQHMEAGVTDQMVAFDTAAETFRRMPPPPFTCTDSSSLLVADGSLMASELGYLSVDLWVLEGYGSSAGEGTWQRRHHFEVPWKANMPANRPREVKRPLVMAAGDGGDVVLGMCHGVMAYNLKSRTVRQVIGGGGTLSLSHHVFRESLVRHRFFDTRPHPGFQFSSFCAADVL